MDQNDEQHLLDYKRYKEALERSLDVERGGKERGILKSKLDSVINCIEMLEK